MKNKLVKLFLLFFFLNSCVGTSTPGVFGTGVSIAFDPRSVGTQIDDSIMGKNLADPTSLLESIKFFKNKNVKT